MIFLIPSSAVSYTHLDVYKRQGLGEAVPGVQISRFCASGLDAIVHDVITKPFAVADIRTAVADALASRKAG